jgi:hypothetical protein
MHDEEVCSRAGGTANGGERRVNRYRASAHRATVLDLDAVQCAGVVGDLCRAEQRVEEIRDFLKWG